ncbi:MAG: hypothetical protein KC964_15580, partial [Candidatus Omnitrophica bacterium]|nr:hypothetical protein [Candidatus Omnitrophota bacterium]
LQARKISLMEDSWTRGIEVSLRDGRTDLFLFPGGDEDEQLVYNRVQLDAEMAWLRLDADRRIRKVAFIRGTGGKVGDHEISFETPTDFFEADLAE